MKCDESTSHSLYLLEFIRWCQSCHYMYAVYIHICTYMYKYLHMHEWKLVSPALMEILPTFNNLTELSPVSKLSSRLCHILRKEEKKEKKNCRGRNVTLILHAGLFDFLSARPPRFAEKSNKWVEQYSGQMWAASQFRSIRAAALRVRSKNQTLSSDSEMRSCVVSFHYLQEPRWENIHWPVSTPWRCHPRASSRSQGSWDGSAQATSLGCTGRMRWSARRWSPMTACPSAPCRQNLQRTEKLY